MISGIINDEVCVFRRRLRWIRQNRGLDNSRYHAKTESNNCFIMYSKLRNNGQHK